MCRAKPLPVRFQIYNSSATRVRAFLLVDSAYSAVVGTGSTGLSKSGPADSAGTSLVNPYAINSAFYFPWVNAPDPVAGYRMALFPPCGFVAGIYASTDANRGVWKAPAGIEASLTGAIGLQYVLTDAAERPLNPLRRQLPAAVPKLTAMSSGARAPSRATTRWARNGNTSRSGGSRCSLESSLYDGTQWAVFEPNDEPLWGQVRLNIGTFMQGLFLQGAFQGTTPQQAYFVKCDAENNPQSSIDALGIVNVTVGFAPLYPAEFVVIQIQQMCRPTRGQSGGETRWRCFRRIPRGLILTRISSSA